MKAEPKHNALRLQLLYKLMRAEIQRHNEDCIIQQAYFLVFLRLDERKFKIQDTTDDISNNSPILVQSKNTK